VVGAARIADLPLQPAQSVLQQSDGLLARLNGLTPSRVIAGQQLHQGSGNLLGAATGALALHRMPFAVADRQAVEQLLG
jgi:hypothetical protein